MRRIFAAAGLALTLCGLSGIVAIPAAQAAASTLTFTSSADTFVTSLVPTTAQGTQDKMRVLSSPEKFALIKFDVTGLAAGQVVDHATLTLTGFNATQPTQLVDVHSVGNTWDETTTYNTRPTPGAVVGSGTMSQNGVLSLDVSVTGNGTVSFAVTTPGTAGDTIIATRENPTTTARPKLTVNFHDQITYGTTGNGVPTTSDCTTTVASGGDINGAITAATAGDVVCVAAQSRTGYTVTLNKAVTLRATGKVSIKAAVVSNAATLEGFTVVGAGAGTPDTGILFSGNGNVIRANLVNGHGLEIGIGCTSCGTTGNLITGNTITKINNYGIKFGNGGGSVIERNNIYDLFSTVENGLDVDAMRIFGHDHVIRENYIHDLNAQRSTTAALPHLDCFQFYQGSNLTAENIVIENNYCVRVSGMFVIAKRQLSTTVDIHDFVIRGNIAETYGWQVLILSGIPGATVENNSFFGATDDGPVITVEHNTDSGAQSSAIRIQNNVLVSGKSTNPGIGTAPTGVITVKRDNVSWVDADLLNRQADFIANPVNVAAPGVTNADFTFYKDWSQEGGALIDQGSTTLSTGFATDVDGASRVRGPIDIGAYELG